MTNVSIPSAFALASPKAFRWSLITTEISALGMRPSRVASASATMFEPRPEIRIAIRARSIASSLCDMTSVKDLTEVVLQMNDIVPHQVLKRRRFGFTDSFKRNRLQTVLGAAIVHLCRVGGRHYMQQMKIVCAPKIHQLGPGRLLVMINLHPSILVIAGKDEIVFDLAQHEPHMIVSGRVDQMANDLFRRPVIFSPRLFALSFTDLQQTRRCRLNRLFEIFEPLVHGLLS